MSQKLYSQLPSGMRNVLTEEAIAVAFVDRHQNVLRYDRTRGQWFIWNDQIWQQACHEEVLTLVRELCRNQARTRPDASKKLGSRSFMQNIERLARSDRRISVTSEQWNRTPMLMGTPAGTLDLRTGNVRPADPNDMITMAAPVAPASAEDCPHFLRFLDEITGGDVDKKGLLKRWFGYCLTGDMREQKFVFFYGEGGNGKGTLLNTVMKAMGAYAKMAAMATFTATKYERHPQELAVLQGARLVAASETEQKSQWVTARIKQITGGDRIRAHFMRENSFEYAPTYKLTFSANNAPSVSEVDRAIRRRMILVPFDFKAETQDLLLERKLEAELPGIIRWMISGCLEWQQLGLAVPASLQAITDKHLSEQDTFSEWLEERVELTNNDQDAILTADLYRDWKYFALERSTEPGSPQAFAESMRRKAGREPIQIKRWNRKGYKGIRRKPPAGDLPKAADNDSGSNEGGKGAA